MRLYLFSLFLTASVFTQAVSSHAQSLSNSVFLKHKVAAERAVERGLDYLASQQLNDGSFGGGYGQSTGVVSLAGMAFLSKGHTPGHGTYSKNLDRCIQYILTSQQSNGLLNKGSSGNGVMYAHNIG
ncbi:MAG: hypothetical protein L3J39_17030, partial [Verrucomicrobiales bacterium]|nr:hypothetical protein [Verrucomicrobiales bacterium]